MKILGITGGTGCGKTTLLRCVERHGGEVIDCDALYHALLHTDAALLEAISARFSGVVTDGELNRKALGKLVFADEAALRDLNAITHGAVCRAVRVRLDLARERGCELAAVDAIALFESGLARLCDCTVAVTAPRSARIERLMRREGISEAYAAQRIAAQKSDAEFSEMSDFTLQNSGTIAEFEEQCEQFLKGVISMSNKYDELRKEVLFAPKNGYDRISEADLAAMEPYCKDYIDFISTCKVEREAVEWTIAEAEKAGFQPLVPGMQLKPGDRVYGNNHKKSVIFAVVGKQSLNEGTHICAAHIDSPRLDLKPNPLYEDCEMAYFKTHYYGGIKKYQWTTTPLAIHGVVAKKDGTVVSVTVGEDESIPSSA